MFLLRTLLRIVVAGFVVNVRVRRSLSPTQVCALSQHGASTGPVDSHTRETTAESRGTRPLPRSCTCICSMSSRSRVPTAAPRGDRSVPPSRTSTHLTDSHLLAPTAAPQGARHAPRTRMSPSPTVCHSRATSLTLRAVRSSPLQALQCA